MELPTPALCYRATTLENPIIASKSTETTTPPHEPLENVINCEINKALSLDLTLFPRYHQINTARTIQIVKKKQATPKEKLLMLINAARWGYNTYDCKYDKRICILRASA